MDDSSANQGRFERPRDSGFRRYDYFLATSTPRQRFAEEQLEPEMIAGETSSR
jgi:hypothetical protein